MTVHHGDSLLVLPTLDADSIDAIVCDPPYGLSFMGKEWDHGVPGAPFWREALRVAKPGAYLVAFGGTRTYHRLACAIEDAGWEIRDCLSWLYGSGFPKSHNGAWGGTALKPAWEPIILARKPLIGTVAANVAAHGTGGLNIDGCRIGTDTVTVNNYRDGKDCTSWSGSRSGMQYETRTQTGRWPANVCLDEAAAELLDAQTGNKGAQGKASGPTLTGESTSASRGKFNGVADTPFYGDTGGASRFFFVAREGQCDNANDATPTLSHVDGLAASVRSLASQKHNQGKCEAGPVSTADCACSTQRHSHASSAEQTDSTGTTPTTPTCCESCGSALPATAESTSQASAERVEAVNVPVSGTRFLYSAKASRREREAGCDTNGHPTVKPIALMRWLCRLVTPKGGTILDPFTGSGTTGCAAVLEGFRFVGIEREAEYVEIATKRIAHWRTQTSDPDLFGEAA